MLGKLKSINKLELEKFKETVYLLLKSRQIKFKRRETNRVGCIYINRIEAIEETKVRICVKKRYE